MLIELAAIAAGLVAAIAGTYHWVTLRQAKKDGVSEERTRGTLADKKVSKQHQELEVELRRLPRDDARRQRVRDRYTRPDTGGDRLRLGPTNTPNTQGVEEAE